MIFKKLCLRVQIEKQTHVGRIRSDHGKEFDNDLFEKFCAEKGIHHEFLAPKTPQHNGVVEQKNRTSKDMVRVMMKAQEVPHKFWGETMNTACHIINRVHLMPHTKITSY